jgi:superfamily II DNA or RNA helicase
MKNSDYQKFLIKKEIIAPKIGFEPYDIKLPLYDFQAAIVTWAIKRGRAAIFADCGLGKTPMQLEWSLQIHKKYNKPVLILAPLAVSKQTQKEGIKFKVKANICRKQEDVTNGINITNYEMLHNFDLSQFIGIVLDESSILKSFTGKYRNQIISESAAVSYRLACTATPAPNDYMELGNHSEFLDVMTRMEMLASFFINDASDTGVWRLRKHGQYKFWKWVCSWAVMLNMPSDLGFDDNGFILPKLNIHHHKIKYGKPLPGQLLALPASTLEERRKARKETIDERAEVVKEIIKNNKTPNLIWCNLNAESEILKDAIPRSVEIKGADSKEHKENSMLNFSQNKIDTLITKPKIAGFGMNWQNCSNVIFMGLSDSYESYYQAVRRCWRFGQNKPVNVHIVTADIEGNVVKNIERKEQDAINMRKEMVINMSEISKTEIKNTKIEMDHSYNTNKVSGKNWELYLGDSVEITKVIDSNSIGYSIFSPPFSDLFTYTDSVRDMGNCLSNGTFLEHFAFLAKELYRVIMPGRLVSVHCSNLAATIGKDGFIGMKDFRGDIIYLFQNLNKDKNGKTTDNNFIYHSEVCIWKDPLIQAVRTKVLTLAHKQVVKDSSRCGQGFADYIVTFRKPGENPIPISRGNGFEDYIGKNKIPKTIKTDDPKTNKHSHQIWQRYASPVWFDINQTRVLSPGPGRSEKDEKHICPLQLDVIERCLELWSTKDDIVLSPFAGIGSEIYCAVQMDRYGIGIELKESYFKQAIKNLQKAERKNRKTLL